MDGGGRGFYMCHLMSEHKWLWGGQRGSWWREVKIERKVATFSFSFYFFIFHFIYLFIWHYHGWPKSTRVPELCVERMVTQSQVLLNNRISGAQEGWPGVKNRGQKWRAGGHFVLLPSLHPSIYPSLSVSLRAAINLYPSSPNSVSSSSSHFTHKPLFYGWQKWPPDSPYLNNKKMIVSSAFLFWQI